MKKNSKLPSNPRENKTEIVQALEKEGIQVFRENLSVSDIKKQGHKKLSKEMASQVSGIFKYAPQIAVDRINSAAVQKAFQDAVEGTYRVKLDPGIHLGISHKEAGAFSANMFDAQGNIKGPAALFVNDATLTVSQVPQYALNVFNAASFVTGQYYMAEVNKKLASIKEGIREIQAILDIQQSSELEAAVLMLQDIINHRFSIAKSDVRLQASLVKLQDLKEKAYETMASCSKQIEFKKSNVNLKKDKDADIEEVIRSIAKLAARYEQAVQLYCMSVILEVFLTNNRDSNELEQFKNELRNIIQSFMANYKSYEEWIDDYLDNVKAINQLSWWQYTKMVLSGAAGGAVGGIKGGILKGIGGAALGAGGSFAIMNENRKKRKEELVSLSNRAFCCLGDDEALEAPVERLSQYINFIQQPSEFIMIGDDCYSNIEVPQS